MRSYDKTIRQLLANQPETSIRHLTGMQFGPLKEENTKLQILLEREPDFLWRTQSPEGNEVVLHVEFQSCGDREMPFRMLEYYAAIKRKYKLSVWQYVVYLGTRPHKMGQEVVDRHNYFGYRVIELAEIPYRQLLSEGDPSLLPLAILADHEGMPEEDVIREITKRIVEGSMDDKNVQTKALAALITLSKMRNLEEVTLQIYRHMSPEEALVEKIFGEKAERSYSEKIAKKMFRIGLVSKEVIQQVTELSFERLEELRKEVFGAGPELVAEA